MKKTIFIIQGYELQSPDGSLSDVCTLEVFAENEKEALIRAKKLVTKKFYRVSGVIEN